MKMPLPLLSSFIIILSSNCITNLAEKNRPCPCAEGWTCCEKENICLPTGETCGDKSFPLDSSPSISDSLSVPDSDIKDADKTTGRCKGNEDCKNDPLNPACHIESGWCVPCTSYGPKCQVSDYRGGKAYQCGCKTQEDCAGNSLGTMCNLVCHCNNQDQFCKDGKRCTGTKEYIPITPISKLPDS